VLKNISREPPSERKYSISWRYNHKKKGEEKGYRYRKDHRRTWQILHTHKRRRKRNSYIRRKMNNYILCPSCRTKNPPEARACIHCGKALNPTEACPF